MLILLVLAALVSLAAAVSPRLAPALAAESGGDWWYVKQLTDHPHGLSGDLALEGNLLVYRKSWEEGIWVHDLTTRGTVHVPEMSGSLDPTIAGHRVLWVEGPLNAFELYCFDTFTRTTRRLDGVCPLTTQVIEAKDDLVVFNLGNPYGGRTDIIAYNFASDTHTTLAQDGAYNRIEGLGRATDGRYVVWSRIAENEMKIFAWDSITGETTLIKDGMKADGPVTHAFESVADGIVAFTTAFQGPPFDDGHAVWMGDPETGAGSAVGGYKKRIAGPMANKDIGVWSIGYLCDDPVNHLVVWDRATNTPTYLTTSDVPRLIWRLNGLLVAWLEGDLAYQDVWVYDHGTGVMTRLTTDEGRKQEMEASGDRIAWLSDPVNADAEDRQLFLASRVPLFCDASHDGTYGTAIHGLEGEGVVSGYETADGGWEFRPEDTVLRAQFAKMMCGTIGLWLGEDDWSDASPPFGDVGPDPIETLYPHEYIAVAAREGITKGTRPGSYSPWAPVSRAQVVTMAVRAVQKAAPDLLTAPPTWYGGSLGTFDPTHADSMRTAEYNGLLTGLDGYEYGWDPWQEASRAETAQILWNLLVRLAPAGGGEFIMAGESDGAAASDDLSAALRGHADLLGRTVPGDSHQQEVSCASTRAGR